MLDSTTRRRSAFFFRHRLAVAKKIWLQGRGAEKSRIEKRGRVAEVNEIRRQVLSAEKSRIKKRCRVAVFGQLENDNLIQKDITIFRELFTSEDSEKFYSDRGRCFTGSTLWAVHHW